MRHIPSEIFTQIFRNCLLELSDWEDQRLTDVKSRPLHSTVAQPVPKRFRFHEGARSLALVCRSWTSLITNDRRLKFLEVLAIPGDYDEETWMEQIDEALSSSPLYPIHIYISVELTPRFMHLIKTHSARIKLLALRSQTCSRKEMAKFDSIIFPRLRYFSWAFLPGIHGLNTWQDLANAADNSLLSAFINKHSSSLSFLWLDNRYSTLFHVGNIAYGITQLHLELVQPARTVSLSLTVVCGLFKACPGLQTLVVCTFGLYSEENETEVNLVSESTLKTVASNLRECILSTDSLLLLQTFCYVSMPRLEALQIIDCCSRARIHSNSLHLLPLIQFPSLKTASFNPLSPLLADFFSFPTFPCLQELSVNRNGLANKERMRETNVFQNCSNLSFLHLSGSYELQNAILKNLSCRSNGSLKVLTMFLMPYSRAPGYRIDEVFEGVPTAFLASIRSLGIATVLNIRTEIMRSILKLLPGIETITLEIPTESPTGFRGIISRRDPNPENLLLPRLKTLKFFFRNRRPTEPINSQKIGKILCEQLEEYLRTRQEAGYRMETLICNHSILPQMAAPLNQYVGAIIHGNKAQYPDHKFHAFRYNKRSIF